MSSYGLGMDEDRCSSVETESGSNDVTGSLAHLYLTHLNTKTLAQKSKPNKAF